METGNKYFVEIQLDCVIEITQEDKEELIKKINNTIEELIKDQKTIHYSSNISSISEENLFAAYVSAPHTGAEGC
jgi:hypothetical protein